MSNPEPAAPPAPPPHVQLIQMCAGGWVAAAVYAAAKLGIADHLAGGARSAAELAPVTGTHAPSLHRFMRTLAGFGILSEGQGRRFALTPLGEALKTGAPGSARATLIAFGGPAFWRPWEEIIYSLETGKTAFEKVWGMPIFDYFAQHPEAAAHFSEAMVGFHGSEPPTVADAYDFSGVGTVVDVGGATGNMLAALLVPSRGLARSALRHAPRRAGGAGAPEGTRRRCTGHDRVGQFLRTSARRWRCLRPVAHHSRLERRSVPDDTRTLPESDGSRGSAPDRRNRPA